MQKTEYWNGFARKRVDLFGFIDIVAVSDHTIGVQCTSDSNVSSRVNKIMEEKDALRTLKKAGWKIQVWGWKKKDGRLVNRIVEIL